MVVDGGVGKLKIASPTVTPVFAAVIGAHLLEEAFGVKDVPDYNEIIRRLGSDYLLK